MLALKEDKRLFKNSELFWNDCIQSGPDYRIRKYPFPLHLPKQTLLMNSFKVCGGRASPSLRSPHVLYQQLIISTVFLKLLRNSFCGCDETRGWNIWLWLRSLGYPIARGGTDQEMGEVMLAAKPSRDHEMKRDL